MAVVSLALVPWAQAGQKIEFSAPSAAWSVPQQELPDNKDLKDASVLTFAPRGDAMDMLDPGSLAVRPNLYVIRRRSQDRYGADDQNNPYAEAESGALGFTNSQALPRAWENDSSPFQRQGMTPGDPFDTASRLDSFNPLNSLGSRENGLNEFNGNSSDGEDSALKSAWDQNGYSASALERMRQGQFVAMTEARAAEEAAQQSSPGAAAAPAFAGAGQQFAPGMDHDSNPGWSVPSLPGSAEADAQSRRAAYARSTAAAAELYFGTRRQDLPPAVLQFPHKPGDVFQ